MSAAPLIVATLTKTSREDVRITLAEFERFATIDIRVWTIVDSPARCPTKRGVTLQVGRLPALIAALQTARVEAERRGLLSP